MVVDLSVFVSTKKGIVPACEDARSIPFWFISRCLLLDQLSLRLLQVYHQQYYMVAHLLLRLHLLRLLTTRQLSHQK